MKIYTISTQILLDNLGLGVLNADENGFQKSVVSQNTDYISSDCIRAAIVDTIRNNNELDENKNDTIVSFADGRNDNIGIDIASDLFGMMRTVGKQDDTDDGKGYSIKRNSLVLVPNVLSLTKRDETNNFGTRRKVNTEKITDKSENKEQMIMNKTYSYNNEFLIPISLNCAKIGVQEIPIYEKRFYVNTEYKSYITPEERKRRVLLFLSSIMNITGFANQSRSAIDTTPSYFSILFTPTQKSIITIDKNNVDKYYDSIELAKKVNGSVYIEGGINPITKEKLELSVTDAYLKALDFINENEIYTFTDEVSKFE